MTQAPQDREWDNKEPQNFVRALARGLVVLEVMGAREEGMTLSEVATATGLDRATARRILLTLSDLRYVHPAGNRFALSPRVLNLGYGYLSSLPFWQLIKPVMGRLVEEVRESCSAAVRDGADIVYVARVRSRDRLVDVSRSEGSRLPAYCTSLGRVLLAAEDPGTQAELLRARPLEKYTKHTMTDVRELQSVLKKTQQQGWALVDQELEIGLRSVAVPLHDGSGRVAAALNLSVQASRVSVAQLRDELLPKLLRIAEEIDRSCRTRRIAP